jgi:hypothetical protein
MFSLIASLGNRPDNLNMKFKLLLCGAALLAAGCDTTPNPYGSSGEYSFTYDLVPQPVPNVTPGELVKIEQAQITSTPVSVFREAASEHNDPR